MAQVFGLLCEQVCGVLVGVCEREFELDVLVLFVCDECEQCVWCGGEQVRLWVRGGCQYGEVSDWC